MGVLFIGGTGNISAAASRLALARGIELHLLTRGQRGGIAGAHEIVGDIRRPDEVRNALRGQRFDAVVNWIAFNPAEIERDLDLFVGVTRQYIFISSASAYQKPPSHPVITESTPLRNPFWQYSRDKIACEERLNRAYRETGFPVTIVRPSLTYDTLFPIAIGGWGCYTIVDRLKAGRPLIVHGDGTSLWTVTHSDDFAKGLVGLLGNPAAVGHAFHITSDELLTWDAIYQTIAGAVGVEADLVHIPSDFIHRVVPWVGEGLLGDKAHSVIFDNSKIKAFVPEFRATIPFHEGARRTLAWFEADASRRVVKPSEHEVMDRIIAAYRAGAGN